MDIHARREVPFAPGEVGGREGGDMKILAISMVIVGSVLIVYSTFFAGRYMEAQKQSQHPVTDIIKEAYRQAEAHWHEVYSEGLDAGERMGFDKGYLSCWNGAGMNWLGSYNRFLEFSKEYGNIHNTPWDKFAIDEKAVIAMYGGSGSTLSVEELTEFIAKYGPANLREHYSNLLGNFEKEAKDEKDTGWISHPVRVPGFNK